MKKLWVRTGRKARSEERRVATEEGSLFLDTVLREIDDLLQHAETRAKLIMPDIRYIDSKLSIDPTDLDLQQVRTLIEDIIVPRFDEIKRDRRTLTRYMLWLRLKNAYNVLRLLIWYQAIEKAADKVARKEAVQWRFKTTPIYWIGVLIGEINVLEAMMISNDFWDLAHKIRASGFQDKRYASRRNLYERAKELADKFWSEGYKLFHHEMAKFLIENVEDFKNLSYPKLRDLLKPIAEKHGKKFGLPGVKKEK